MQPLTCGRRAHQLPASRISCVEGAAMIRVCGAWCVACVGAHARVLQAILARRESEDKDAKIKILELTKDHKCMMAKERERVTKAGGFIQDNRVNGIMEVRAPRC